MPKVPESEPLYDTRSIPGVSFPNRPEYGRVGEATTHLGEDIQETAARGLQVYDQIKYQSDVAASENAQVQTALWADQRMRELKLASPDGMMHENGDPQQPVVQNDDGTQRSITQQFWDEANEHYQSQQDSLSSQGAAMYRQKALPEIGSRAAILNNESYSMRLSAAENQRNQTNQDVYSEFQASPYDKTYDGVRNRPDLNKFSDYAQKAQLGVQRQAGTLNEKTGQFEGGIYNQTQVDQINSKQMNEYGQQWMDAAIQKLWGKTGEGPTNSQDVLNLLDVVRGEDPQSKAFSQTGKITVNSALSPDQRDAYEDKLRKMIPAAQAMDKSEYKYELQQHIAAANQGQYPLGIPSSSRQNLMNWQKTLSDNGQMTPAERLSDLGQIYAAEGRGMLGGADFYLMPQSSQHALSDKTSEKAFTMLQQDASQAGLTYSADAGAQAKNEIAARGIENVQRIEHMKQSDFAGFMAGMDDRGNFLSASVKKAANQNWASPAALEKSGAVQPMLASLGKAYHANYGNDLTYWRPISKDQSATLGASLQGMSADVAAPALDNLRRAFGSSFPNLIDTMIQDKSLPESWRVPGTIPSLQARSAYISTLQSRKDIQDLFEKSGKKMEDVQSEVEKQYGGTIQAMVNAAPKNRDQLQYANELRSTLATGAMQQAISNPGQSISDSVANAKGELYKNFPTPVTIGNKSFFGLLSSGPQITTERPQGLSETQWGTIQQNLEHYITEPGLKELGVSEPKGQQHGQEGQFIPMVAKNLKSISLGQGGYAGHTVPGYYFDYQGVNPDTGRPNGISNPLMKEDKNSPTGASRVFVPLSQLMLPNKALQAKPPTQPVKKYQPAGISATGGGMY